MDLYDDLDFALIDSVAVVEPGPEDAPEYKELKTECKAKESKISELSDKVQKLEAQNKILRKNISCLFKTAKAEVQRKDSIMQEQRDKIARLEVKLANENRECGCLGNEMMSSSASSITEREMVQFWLLQCQQQQQFYGGDYTGHYTNGAWQEAYYNTCLNGYRGSASSKKRSAGGDSEQPRRRPFMESQTAAVAVEQHTLSKKPDHQRDRHRSVSKKCSKRHC